MFKVAVGQSEDVIMEEVVKEIFEQIHATLGEIIPQAGIMFCPLDVDYPYILNAIQEEFPGIELVGCTTDGELCSVYGFAEDAVCLMVFASDVIEIRAGVGRGTSGKGKEVGREAALSACNRFEQHKGEEKFAIILTDPLNAGVSDVDKGIAEILGERFPLIGAASAAFSKKRTTQQFYNQEVLTDSMVLLVFAGKVTFSCGIKGGHSPIAGKGKVTLVKKNVLYRIGNEPALEYFRRYIGTEYGLFMNYCLAVFEKDRDSFYVRSAPFYDEKEGSVTLNGVVPEGAMVQIGTADKATCVESCQASLQMAIDNYPGTKPEAAVFFSCAGRKMILGTQVFKEDETVKKYLGDIPYCGFYAYGEFGPLKKGDKPLFHGTTFVTLLIGTEEA